MKRKPIVITLLSAVGIIIGLQALDIAAERQVTDKLTTLQNSIQRQMPGSTLHWSWVSASGIPYSPKIVIKGLDVSQPNAHEYISFSTLTAKPFSGIISPVIITDIALNTVIAKTTDNKVTMTAEGIDFGSAHWTPPKLTPGQPISAVSIIRSLNNKFFDIHALTASITGETGHFTTTLDTFRYNTLKPDLLSTDLSKFTFRVEDPNDRATPITSLSIGSFSLYEMPYKHLLGLSEAVPVIMHTKNPAAALQIGKTVLAAALDLEEDDIQTCIQNQTCNIFNALTNLRIKAKKDTILDIDYANEKILNDTIKDSKISPKESGVGRLTSISFKIDTAFVQQYIPMIQNVGMLDIYVSNDTIHVHSNPEQYKMNDMTINVKDFGEFNFTTDYSVKNDPKQNFADNISISSFAASYEDHGYLKRMLDGQSAQAIDDISLPDDLTDANKKTLRDWLKQIDKNEIVIAFKPDHPITIADIQAGLANPSALTLTNTLRETEYQFPSDMMNGIVN